MRRVCIGSLRRGKCWRFLGRAQVSREEGVRRSLFSKICTKESGRFVFLDRPNEEGIANFAVDGQLEVLWSFIFIYQSQKVLTPLNYFLHFLAGELKGAITR
jgi:hypothetical protein